MPKVEDDKLAKQYLLGELSEPELGKLEEEYFEDDAAFERLSATEDELIDAYTLGQLSSAERKGFERRLLLSTAQRERVHAPVRDGVDPADAIGRDRRRHGREGTRSR